LDITKRYNHKTGKFEPFTYYPTAKPNSSSQTHAESSKVCDYYILNTLNNKLTKSLYLRGKVDDAIEEKEICILLDTGAESNFISEEFAYYLENFCSCLRSSNSLINSVVCSAFDNCQLTNGDFIFNLKVIDSLHGVSVSISKLHAATVSKLPCDIVIGRKTIAIEQLLTTFKLHLDNPLGTVGENKIPGRGSCETSQMLLPESTVSGGNGCGTPQTCRCYPSSNLSSIRCRLPK
jgi:hypothetical protein